MKRTVTHTDDSNITTAYIDSILNNIVILLTYAKKFYNFVGYNGLLHGKIRLQNFDDVLFYPIYYDKIFDPDLKKSLLTNYKFELEIDTLILNDTNKFNDYCIKLASDLNWGLGYPYELSDTIQKSIIENIKNIR